MAADVVAGGGSARMMALRSECSLRSLPVSKPGVAWGLSITMMRCSRRASLGLSTSRHMASSSA